MPTVQVDPRSAVKRRPKDRKAQIARASAEAFSALGYHAVSMSDIASRVGISAAGLYRHASSKYELFRDAVISLGEQLVEQTAFADQATSEVSAADLLDQVIRWQHEQQRVFARQHEPSAGIPSEIYGGEFAVIRHITVPTPYNAVSFQAPGMSAHPTKPMKSVGIFLLTRKLSPPQNPAYTPLWGLIVVRPHER